MAQNTDEGYRKGSVCDRTQIQNPRTGNWTKRDTNSGKFIDGKKGENRSKALPRKRTAEKLGKK